MWYLRYYIEGVKMGLFYPPYCRTCWQEEVTYFLWKIHFVKFPENP